MTSASKFQPGTLPGHDSCIVHRSYKLGCEQYEGLLARSGQRCEICDLPGKRNSHGKLHIDHLGSRWAVRGLLCNRCNSRLTRLAAHANVSWAAEYLANSWWIKECERIGVSPDPTPEPPHGSAIRDQWNVVWLRDGDGEWRPHGSGKPGISSASWDWLYDQRGPQNMALINLEEDPVLGQWLVSDAERAQLYSLVRQLAPDLDWPHWQRLRVVLKAN